MAVFDDDFKERVRDAVDIVAVVGEHVPLKRAGRLWRGLCPFHREKTPSFYVNPERRIFKCFGCDAGGDVFRFLQEFERLSFPEALELLAGRAGLPMPRRRTGGAPEESPYPALAWAAERYHAFLSGPEGATARRYLEERGMGTEMVERFQIGWAPPGWSSLLDAAARRFPFPVLSRAGLITEREGGGHYDRFRGRVMFPIRSALGKVVGFGARAMGDEEPKYLNSPETDVFQKSRLLYGIHEAREELRRGGRGIVVEGYMDVLGMVQAGFLNTVASCGTAFTSEQARLLKRYVDRAVLLFDGDRAGVKAAWRSAGVFLGEGFDVRVIVLPAEHDPDSFVRDEGREAMLALLENAPDVVGFARDVLLDRLEGREDLIRAFAHLAAAIDDPIRRRVLVQQAAEAFRFDERLLAGEAERMRRGEARKRAPAAARQREQPDMVGREYLAHLLADPPLDDESLVDEALLKETPLRALYRRWRELREAGSEHPGRAVRDEAEHERFAAAIEASEGIGETPFDQILGRLRERERAARVRELRTAIEDAEARGDQPRVEELMRELGRGRAPGA